MRRSAFLALGLLAAGCAGYQHFPWFPSQRWPGPMEAQHEPLPAGDATKYPRGPEEVRVLRHADPVQVRMAGSAGNIPLSYKRKEMRIPSGSGVASSGGGRAEVLWPSGSSVILFGFTDAIIGSPSRGEPSLILRDIDRVRFEPKAEDQYELCGGAVLRVRAGPVRVTRPRSDVLRIANESKRSAQVAFRGETIVLDPDQGVDLPILKPVPSAGPLPATGEPKVSTFQGPGFSVEVGDGSSTAPESGAVVARGGSFARALGVRVELSSGIEARFSGLAAPAANPAAANPPR